MAQGKLWSFFRHEHHPPTVHSILVPQLITSSRPHFLSAFKSFNLESEIINKNIYFVRFE